MAIFEKSLQKLRDDFGSWKTPWGEFNRYQRNDGKIIQNFDDTKKSLPVGMASGNMGCFSFIWYTIWKKYYQAPVRNLWE